jgi:hypothetical protein
MTERQETQRTHSPTGQSETWDKGCSLDKKVECSRAAAGHLAPPGPAPVGRNAGYPVGPPRGASGWVRRA